MKDCLFCDILDYKKPADIVYENDKVVVFKDINPKTRVHLLIVPRKHIKSVNELELKDKDLIGDIILTAQKMAQEYGIDKSGYKLLFNVGRGGGQLVDHIHLHLMGGGEIQK